MSNDSLILLLSYVVFVIAGGVSAYAAYIALSVRRGLVVSIYRSRALWTGVFLIVISIAFIGTADPPLFTYIGLPLTVVLLAYIDRTIGTITRLDYLRRDVLGWRKLRIPWAASAMIYYYPVFALFNGSIIYDFLAPFPLGYLSLTLIVGSRRTRDMTFQSHARWFAYLLGTFALFAISINTTSSLLPVSFVDVLSSYCMYRMAKSLVPVSRFPTS